IHSMETLGDKPAIRFEVNIAKAKTLYPQDVEPPKMQGIEWIKVVLNRKPGPSDHGNRPHVTFEELANNVDKTHFQGTQRVVHDDRGVANFIYGYEKNLPAYNPK